jgi:cytochrome c oxidase subunit 2
VFRPVSSPADSIHRYSLFVLGITGAIFAVVFTMLVVAIVRFRLRPGDDAAEPPQVYGSEQVEMAWTVVPILIVIVLALTTARTVFEVLNRVRPPAALRPTTVCAGTRGTGDASSGSSSRGRPETSTARSVSIA